MPVRLSREVRVGLSDDRSRPARNNSWAAWPPAEAIGSFVIIKVWVDGEPSRETGYLRDIRDLDALVYDCCLDALARPSSSAEHTVLTLWKKVAAAVDGLELHVSPYLRYRVARPQTSDPGGQPVLSLTQQFEFSAAHRLHSPLLSDEENRRLFGKCNSPNYHGHNYLVDVTITGTLSQSDGRLLAVVDLERIVKETVIDRFDHKNLNLDLPEFAEQNTSVENIARVIFELLTGKLEPAQLVSVRVYETAKTWAEYHA